MPAILKIKDAEGNVYKIPAIQGEKGEKGDTGKAGANGRDSLVALDDANANNITAEGIYLCKETLVNFPAEIGNGDGGNDVVMLVFNSKTGGLADVTSQVVVGYGHIEEGVGESLQSSVFSRYYDGSAGTWSEWAEGVTIPDGSITAAKIADDVPVSKFTNDAGYLTGVPTEKLEKLVSKTFEADQTGWTVSADDNGDPLHLKGVVIRLTYPAATTTNIYFKAMCGSVMVGQCPVEAYTKTSAHYAILKILQESGRWMPRWSPWNTNTTVISTTGANEWDALRIAGSDASVYKLIDSILVTESHTIPSGATIEIWGVKASEAEIAAATAAAAAMVE